MRNFFALLLPLCLGSVSCVSLYAAVPATPLPVGPRAAVASDEANRSLNSGWQFRAVAGSAVPAASAGAMEWHAATVPGVVQTDLLANKLILDPFYGQDEKDLQWIGLTDWEYRATINVTAAELSRGHADLVFDGLDTFADVYVNDKLVLSADNDFRRWTVDAKTTMQPGSNQVRVVFHSPVTKMQAAVKAMPYHLPTVGQVAVQSEGGIAVDPYVRKAPYNFGWDWGPRYITEGIWHDVYLRTWNTLRLDDAGILQPKVTAERADLQADVLLEASTAGPATVSVSYSPITAQGHGAWLPVATRSVALDAGDNHAVLPFSIAKPKLWWPNGYGAQDRYVFRVTVTKTGRVLASREIRTGLRSVELRRQPDQWGKSFEFLINGVPIFAKGADVIPFDSFAPRVTPEDHRKILQAARDTNMNMLRDWGGGYYESDDYYDIADELGIMLWQEFMFGGALVPGTPEFRANVREEAKEQVLRLRNHPSIVHWCGNNESETGWQHWGDFNAFKHALKPDQQEDVWQAYLLLFSNVIQSTLAEYDPQANYMPSSPSSDYDENADSDTNGDRHYWAVWGGDAPITDYLQQKPRFASEYGFQSFPEMRTIRSFAKPDELQLDSPVMHAHQKANGGNERIRKYMQTEYPDPKDFPSFVYLSQVQQAEAIKLEAETLRRDRPRTMGSLFWQINDCWPVASWSSIDSLYRWKALQYYARHFYSDVLVSPTLHDGVVDTYIVSDKTAAMPVHLHTAVKTFDGRLLGERDLDVSIPPLSSQQVLTQPVSAMLGGTAPQDAFVLFELRSGGKVLSSNTLYFAPVKSAHMPHAAVQTAWSTAADGKPALTLQSASLARDVYVSFGDNDATLSDNYVTLLPGEPVTIEVTTPDLAAAKGAMQVMTLADAFATAP